jgi:hypothetical protein
MTATTVASQDGTLHVQVTSEGVAALTAHARQVRGYARLSRDLGNVAGADNLDREAASLERYADTLTARLDVTDPVQPIIPPAPTPGPKPAPPKRRTVLRVIGAVVACLAVLVGIAPHASARVYPTTNPIRVVVSGPRAIVSAQLISTAARPDGTHAAALIGPNGFMVSGESRVRGPIVPVNVSGTIPSYLLTPGTQMWVASDAGDESYVGVGVKVLRQSRFASVRAFPVSGGRVVVVADLQHYDIQANAYRPSKLSPVAVQYQTGSVQAKGVAQWRTAGTITTDAVGNPAAGLVRLPKGAVRVRMVRAEGATVTSAITGTFTVRVS